MQEEQRQVLAEAKRLFALGQVIESLAFYEAELAKLNREDKNTAVFKARLSVDFARKLIELELFPRAFTLLE